MLRAEKSSDSVLVYITLYFPHQYILLFKYTDDIYYFLLSLNYSGNAVLSRPQDWLQVELDKYSIYLYNMVSMSDVILPVWYDVVRRDGIEKIRETRVVRLFTVQFTEGDYSDPRYGQRSSGFARRARVLSADRAGQWFHKTRARKHRGTGMHQLLVQRLPRVLAAPGSD